MTGHLEPNRLLWPLRAREAATKPPKQPYAIAMRDYAPFCVAAIWDEGLDPNTGGTRRTFAVITCPANELVGQIHNRMPVIIAQADSQIS